MTYQLPPDEVSVEFTQGHGPGGQHRNKTASACRATHIPTGIVVFIQNNRCQHANKREAIKTLSARVEAFYAAEKAKLKKAHRDYIIHNEECVRTYNFQRGTVKDHRSGKTASLKDVLEKGKIDLLRPDPTVMKGDNS
jgi:peptide chain release factor 1